MSKTFYDICWDKIIDRGYPEFPVALEVIEILKEEAKKERYFNYDGTICRSISSSELRSRLQSKGIKISPQYLCKIVHAFLKKKNIYYEPRKGNTVTFSQITYSHKILKDLDGWAQKIYNRRN